MNTATIFLPEDLSDHSTAELEKHFQGLDTLTQHIKAERKRIAEELAKRPAAAASEAPAITLSGVGGIESQEKVGG